MIENRRSKLRYNLQLELMYRTLKRKRNVAGSGTTCNLSSKAILFQPSDELFEGDQIEATIHWPVLLGNTLRLNLALRGIVTRSDGRGCVVKMHSHVFRTRASRPVNAAAGDCTFLPMVEKGVAHVASAKMAG